MSSRIKKNPGYIEALLFYVAVFIVVLLCNTLMPAGPCTPPGSLLIFMIMIPVSAILFLYSMFRAFTFSKTALISGIIHLTACLLLLCFFMNA